MIELLRARRSIRKYRSDSIMPEKTKILQEALLRSPSSRNIQPWEFIFVDDPGLLQKLARCKPHGAAFLKDAVLGIVICADETKSDVWVEDCAIASILVQLTAQSLGLGSCWVQIRKRMHDDQQNAEAFIQGVLEIPPNLRVESVIAIGQPAEEKSPVPREKLDFRKIKHNRYT